MTYLAPHRARARYAKRRPALADWLDDLFTPTLQPAIDQQCLDQANASTAPLDAKTNDLAKNWNPTGFYASADVRKLISSAMAVVQQGQAALDQAAAEPSAAQDSIMRATGDLADAGQKSMVYLQAANAADQQGTGAINAPGLKRWVTDTMGAASSAMVTAATIGCLTPWWVTALSAFQSVFDVLYAIAAAIVGIAADLAKLAIKVPDAVDDAITILKWGLGLGGAAWLLYELYQAKERAR